VPGALVEALRHTLLDEHAEQALLAELLSLPGVGYLGDFMPQVDVEGLHAARERLRTVVAQTLREDLLMRYEQLRDDEPYSPDAGAIGRRRLKNMVLGYLASLQDQTVEQLLLDQYGMQHNMTDVMAALALIADSDRAVREEILQDFAQRWQQDALVMDKWFTVQSMADRPAVLAEVRQLMQHPAFSISNPNKVRALIGAFVNGNPLHFHAADGSGYRFLTDQVLTLDPMNPQIAARLLRAMARWRRYDEGRQAAMREALERVLQTEVSKDVYEVAARSLDLS